MKDLLARIQVIPSLILNVVNAFLDGIGKQSATFKGASIIFLGGIFIFDLITKGSFGIIAFCIEKFNALLTVTAETAKNGNWQLIVLALIVLLWKKDSK